MRLHAISVILPFCLTTFALDLVPPESAMENFPLNHRDTSHSTLPSETYSSASPSRERSVEGLVLGSPAIPRWDNPIQTYRVHCLPFRIFWGPLRSYRCEEFMGCYGRMVVQTVGPADFYAGLICTSKCSCDKYIHFPGAAN
jgi:hypothetical protein